MKSALLVIDVQNSFLHKDDWFWQDFPAFSQNISRLIAGCQSLDLPVVDVFHLSSGVFAPESGLVKRMSFLEHRADLTVEKKAHSALTVATLRQWLEAENIEQLVISGIRTEQCCETTARAACDAGMKVLFVTEATLTLPMQWQGVEYSVQEIQQHTSMVLHDRFATVCTVDECLQRLASA